MCEGTPVSCGGFSIQHDNVPGDGQAVGVAIPAQINAAGVSLNAANQLSWGECNQFTTGAYAEAGDGPNITFNFNSPVKAFGFELSDNDITDAYRISLNGETFVLSGAATAFTGYFGFMTEVEILSLVLSQSTTGGGTRAFAFDNVSYSAAAVPLPSVLMLLVSGLGGPASLRRLKSGDAKA